mmetsp:Transcript_3100/g.7613  ORF Transcript_3100/g.7613 Transcript_3100/m.7613 type:complete len:201 (+) Transcript_3100:1464-2066(+)
MRTKGSSASPVIHTSMEPPTCVFRSFRRCLAVLIRKKFWPTTGPRPVRCRIIAGQVIVDAASRGIFAKPTGRKLKRRVPRAPVVPGRVMTASPPARRSSMIAESPYSSCAASLRVASQSPSSTICVIIGSPPSPRGAGSASSAARPNRARSPARMRAQAVSSGDGVPGVPGGDRRKASAACARAASSADVPSGCTSAVST